MSSKSWPKSSLCTTHKHSVNKNVFWMNSLLMAEYSAEELQRNHYVLLSSMRGLLAWQMCLRHMISREGCSILLLERIVAWYKTSGEQEPDSLKSLCACVKTMKMTVENTDPRFKSAWNSQNLTFKRWVPAAYSGVSQSAAAARGALLQPHSVPPPHCHGNGIR